MAAPIRNSRRLIEFTVPFPTAPFYLICVPRRTVSNLTDSSALLWTMVIVLIALTRRVPVHRYIKTIVLGVSLIVPVAITAQDRGDQRNGRPEQ